MLLNTMVLPAVSASVLKPSTVARYLKSSSKLFLLELLIQLTSFVQAHLCILAADCDSLDYVRLVEALAKQHSLCLIKVLISLNIAIYLACVVHIIRLQISSGWHLGELVGLAKLDREGNPRKVVKCSCAVVSPQAMIARPIQQCLIFENRSVTGEWRALARSSSWSMHFPTRARPSPPERPAQHPPGPGNNNDSTTLGNSLTSSDRNLDQQQTSSCSRGTAGSAFVSPAAG
jgi:ribosomal protein L7Ae-like RNA K-turn-binding protein